MNLIQGKIVDNNHISKYMTGLNKLIKETLNKSLLNPHIVIEACEKLISSLPNESILPIMEKLGIGNRQAIAQIKDLRLMFSREYLKHRLEVELGDGYEHSITKNPLDINVPVTEQVYPLGVLFHIAAGNMDGLPVYSVIEGLLAGNINLLKLPAVDGGLTVMILQKLCEIEPELSDYIYVFELSSKETSSISQLANIADAIVVWGGDEAVKAIRKMAPPNVKIIEWGHKLSFAYVTQAGMTQENLEGLAHNICSTNQLLCSSCQGIFLDTNSMDKAQEFCHMFLPILESVATEYPNIPLAAKAQSTLQLRTRALERLYGDSSKIYKGTYSSLILELDSNLSASLQFRNLWVKTLEKDQIISALHQYKSHLQTAALLCSEDEWNGLCEKLWRAGVVRICSGEDMSKSYCGAAHDGEYPLRRYTKVVSAQQ